MPAHPAFIRHMSALPVHNTISENKIHRLNIRCEAFLEKRQVRLRSILENPFFFESDELIHQLRVEMKKLKAMVMLLDFSLGDNSYKKEFRELKPLYQAAGEVRKSVLMLSRLQDIVEMYVPLSLHAELEKQIVVQRRKLRKIYSAGAGNRVCEFAGSLQDKIPEIGQQQVSGFLTKIKMDVRRLGTGRHLKKTRIHEIRKFMKLYLAVSGMTDRQGEAGMLKEMAGAAGDWHDAVELTDFLKKFAQSASISSGDLDAVGKLLETTKERTAALLTDFLLLQSGYLQRDFI